MIPLQERLIGLRDGGRKLFVPYVTAGLPSEVEFAALLGGLAEHADAIEVGIPFSDPMMDGPVIQESSRRAIEVGVTARSTFELLATLDVPVPVVVMTYVNIVDAFGADEFISAMTACAVQGAIIPDLPLEASGRLCADMADAGLGLVQMVAPSTSAGRAGQIAHSSRGFVYAVSRMGITGLRTSLSDEAKAVVEKIRPHTSLPVLLGIGISDGPQAREAASIADGVVVGSALVRRVLDGDVAGALTLAGEIRAALER
ncbi:MAG TPA: tryptophan synthase subunit alpha [Actinomycetota bacterium]|nr:tryptophan synthase subunit alpha [Actinomycetota bacterium]